MKCIYSYFRVLPLWQVSWLNLWCVVKLEFGLFLPCLQTLIKFEFIPSISVSYPPFLVISFWNLYQLDIILWSETPLLEQVMWMQQEAIGKFLWVGVFQFCSGDVPLRQMLQHYRKNGEKYGFIDGLFQIVWCLDVAQNCFWSYWEILSCEPLKRSKGSVNLVVQLSLTIFYGVFNAVYGQDKYTSGNCPKTLRNIVFC